MKQFAFGQDDRPLELGDDIKSISGEETFLQDTDDRKVLRTCLREQASDISGRLKRRRLGAHTVQVKVRYGDFTTLTRQITVEEPLTEAGDIYRLGCFLLGREKLVSRPLPLLGLGVASPSRRDNSWCFCEPSLCFTLPDRGNGYRSSTSLTLQARVPVENGFCRKAVPGSSTP